MKSLLLALAFAGSLCAAETPATPTNSPAPLRVFIRSGPKTHGPGDHDHPAFLRDWVPLLNAAGAKATGSDSFPTAAQLAETDVLIIHRQGGGDFKPEEQTNVAAFAHRGGGFVVIHAGTVASNDPATEFFKNLIGGAWKQKVTKWREGPMELNFVDTANPLVQGIKDFKMKDEIYYDMDLRSDIHALATAPTPKKKDGTVDVQTQIWTYENEGHRAFVFIPGHTYVNFARDDVKTLLLRGICWAGRRSNVNELCK
jgi:type 1 glutamine amidotransferase